MDTKKKETELMERLRSLGKVLLAFSGGVDSTYLLVVAREVLGKNCRAVFVRGAMVPTQEEKEALVLGQCYARPLVVLNVDILALRGFQENPTDRCYHCKKRIFETILDYGEQNDYLQDGYLTVIDGTNASDTSDYRPGRKALQELGIVSPLLEVGLSKVEIRDLSKDRKLPNWDKPAMACLATRIPFGDPISAVLLRRIDQAETILRQKGHPECRVRLHGDIARIEIPITDFPAFLGQREVITEALRQLGFRYITLDLTGLLSGNLNPGKREDMG